MARKLLNACIIVLCIALVALGWVVAYVVNQSGKRALATERANSAEIAERVGAGCEPAYQVAWLERRCDGMLGWAPRALQAAACPARISTARVQDLERARRRIREAGPGASGMVLLEQRGLRERQIEIVWEPRLGE